MEANIDFMCGGRYCFISMATPPANGHKTELEYNLRTKKIDAVVSIAGTFIKYLALVTCVGFVYLMISSLSGKTTFATIGVSVLGNLSVSHGIYIVLTAGSIIYGLGQRRLRRRVLGRLTSEKESLEKLLDPNRTSSGLTERGTTRPGDEI